MRACGGDVHPSARTPASGSYRHHGGPARISLVYPGRRPPRGAARRRGAAAGEGPSNWHFHVEHPGCHWALIEAFKQGLTEQGYAEGQNLILEPRYWSCPGFVDGARSPVSLYVLRGRSATVRVEARGVLVYPPVGPSASPQRGIGVQARSVDTARASSRAAPRNAAR